MDNYVQHVLEIEELKKEIAKLKKRVQEAEGEVTIIRGIGMNSPEFRALKKENKELKEDNKKLASLKLFIKSLICKDNFLLSSLTSLSSFFNLSISFLYLVISVVINLSASFFTSSISNMCCI